MNRLIQLFLVLLFSPLLQSERLLTTDDGIWSAQWSPKGSHIVYTKRHEGTRGLVRIDADGSNPLQLASAGRNEWIRWSPDGSQILYTRTNVEHSGDNTIYRRVLHVVDADGGQDRAVLERTHHYLLAEWSPDSSQILAYSDRELFLIHPDGSNLIPLASGDTIGISYLWSPDGKQIAFIKRDDSSIWVMNADGSGGKRIIARIDLGAIKWSPDSLKIAFQYKTVSPSFAGMQMGVVEINGSHFTLLADHPTGNSGGLGWSPDGTKIVYSDSSNVYLVSADGSQQSQLTTSLTFALLPTWSSDGMKIAFIGSAEVGWELYVMDGDGSHRTQVTDNEVAEQAFVWSPDGKQLAFDGGTQPYTSLHLIASSGGTPTLLSANVDVGAFALAPNEEKVAFTRYSLLGRDLFFVNPDGSNLTRLTMNEQIDHFVWSPDGQRLALYLDQKGLYVIDANATEVTDAARISTQVMLLTFQWLPEGAQLLFEENGDLYLIDATSGNTTRLTTESIFSMATVSPKARTVAYFRTIDSQTSLFTLDLDSSVPTLLLYTWGKTPESLQWSPDGSKIAYFTMTDDPIQAQDAGVGIDAPLPPTPLYSRIYVVNADGSNNTFVAEVGYAAWTPDSRWLQIGNSLIRPDRSERIDFEFDDPIIRGSWSPDGTQVVYRVDSGSDLYPTTSIYIGRLNLE